MDTKKNVALAVAIAALVVTTWKGPNAWGAASAAIGTIAIFAATIFAKSKSPAVIKLETYIADLEAALAEAAPQKLAALKNKR